MTTEGSEKTWADNLAHELDFWRQSLSADSELGELHRRRLQTTELWPWIQERIPADSDPVRVLDVGSGPLTTLGTLWPGRTVEVVALDPLADAYNELLDELGFEPPVRPVSGRVEELTNLFPLDHFDFVNASNSLDHAADPILGIEQMIAVLKSGASLHLIHYKNVGEREQYIGLHQWNLAPAGDDMDIEGAGRSARLSELLPGYEVSAKDHETLENMFDVMVKKPDRRPSKASG